jgi:hypothetical protein
MSFVNIIMYSAVLPSYHSADEKDVIRADDSPDMVRQILFGGDN